MSNLLELTNMDFTNLQATDLARYFLGREWYAYQSGHATYVVRSIADTSLVHHGEGWREAFRKAGVKLPLRWRYTQQGNSVMLNGENMAVCPNGTKAKLISDALNSYTLQYRA
jgi:hypothetical protein